MAVLNDFGKDFKHLLVDEDKTVKEVSEKTGIATTNVYQIFNSNSVVKKSFASLIENLGYDIEVVYKKRV